MVLNIKYMYAIYEPCGDALLSLTVDYNPFTNRKDHQCTNFSRERGI
jgi:hypothetical protein